MPKHYIRIFRNDSIDFNSGKYNGLYIAQDRTGLVYGYKYKPEPGLDRWKINSLDKHQSKVFIYNGPINEQWDSTLYFQDGFAQSVEELCNGHIHKKEIMKYAEDAQVNEYPWMLWEMRHKNDGDERSWKKLQSNPRWADHMVYRRTPEKKIAVGDSLFEEEYFKDAIISLKKTGYDDVAKAIHKYFEVTDIER